MLQYNIYPAKFPKAIKAIVFLLHGYGANSHDLLSLIPELDVDLEHILFVSPNAPEPLEDFILSDAYQWFSLRNRTVQNMDSGAEKACIVLDQFIKQCIAKYANGIALKCFLIGFSQGAMMALYYGLHKNLAIDGIISFSGKLLGTESIDTKNITTNILLLHGDEDSVVPLDNSIQAQKFFEEHHMQSELYISKGLAHGIDHNCIHKAKNFLQKILKN